MEDFHDAFLERHADGRILQADDRRIAAMHFGGITVECFLKHLITSYHGISEWKTDDHDPGHTITNPGHDLAGAVRRINRLYQRIKTQPQVLRWLEQVEQPRAHFISLRYHGGAVDDICYREWKQAYEGLLRWLAKQSTQL